MTSASGQSVGRKVQRTARRNALRGFVACMALLVTPRSTEPEVTRGSRITRGLGVGMGAVVCAWVALSSFRLLDHEPLGLVAFPSFHTTAGILFTWALWTSPRLRWPAVMVNGLMLVSVPVIGAHYLIDLIAGVIVAWIGIAGAGRLMKRSTSSYPSASC